MKDAIVGAWELIGWTRPLAPRNVPASFVGRLVYTREGWMSTIMHPRDRRAFIMNDAVLKDPLDADPRHLAEGMRGCIAYAGRWFLREDAAGWIIEHRVEASIFPNWAPDTEESFPLQIRRVEVEGDVLRLTAAEGGSHRTTLTWRRLP